jgi:hypothetical protein
MPKVCYWLGDGIFGILKGLVNKEKRFLRPQFHYATELLYSFILH